jgi:hypothetical protein
MRSYQRTFVRPDHVQRRLSRQSAPTIYSGCRRPTSEASATEAELCGESWPPTGEGWPAELGRLAPRPRTLALGEGRSGKGRDGEKGRDRTGTAAIRLSDANYHRDELCRLPHYSSSRDRAPLLIQIVFFQEFGPEILWRSENVWSTSFEAMGAGAGSVVSNHRATT